MSLASDSKQEERGADADPNLLASRNAEWNETLKKRLHISNISFTVHENSLSKFLLSKFGVCVAHCKIIRNACNKKSKVIRSTAHFCMAFNLYNQFFLSHYNSLKFTI